jgi:hypothetical protein
MDSNEQDMISIPNNEIKKIENNKVLNETISADIPAYDASSLKDILKKQK